MSYKKLAFVVFVGVGAIYATLAWVVAHTPERDPDEYADLDA